MIKGSFKSNEILDGLKKSIDEMRLMKEGKIPKRSMNDFLKRMEEKYLNDDE